MPAAQALGSGKTRSRMHRGIDGMEEQMRLPVSPLINVNVAHQSSFMTVYLLLGQHPGFPPLKNQIGFQHGCGSADTLSTAVLGLVRIIVKHHRNDLVVGSDSEPKKYVEKST